MHKNATYREQSLACLERAYAELEAGDLLQASEDGWGAAEAILKAVAQERGWEHDNLRQIVEVYGRLAAEAQRGRLTDGFDAAFMLYTVLQEGWTDSNWVQFSLDDVRDFVADVEGMLNGR